MCLDPTYWRTYMYAAVDRCQKSCYDTYLFKVINTNTFITKEYCYSTNDIIPENVIGVL